MLVSIFRQCYWGGSDAGAVEYMTLLNCCHLLCMGGRELFVYTELIRTMCEDGARMLDMRLSFRNLMMATATPKMRDCAKVALLVMHRFPLPAEIVWMILERAFEKRKDGDVTANVARVKAACESVVRAAYYVARFWLPRQRQEAADEVLSVQLSNDHILEISNCPWDAALVAHVLGI
jgi:hypothetical protein